MRKIDKAIDVKFIRDEVAYLHCQDNGRPAVTPVRLFKIILLCYILRWSYFCPIMIFHSPTPPHLSTSAVSFAGV